MSDQPPPRQINFSIVPDDRGDEPRVYANFCGVAHTPFDFTLTFCEVMPLSERDIHEAQSAKVVKAPVRAKIVVPTQFVPTLITTLQEHMRAYSDSSAKIAWKKDPVH